MPRFSKALDLDRRKIAVDPSRFQGRQGEFSDDTVKAIVAKGHYDRNADEIQVWQDPTDGIYYIISGHSRWEAAKQLFESGAQPDLQTVPVKEFIGDEDTAIDYATIESNRGSTDEGLKSDLEAYRRAVARGWNRARLMGAFKPESKLQKLKELVHLSENSAFLQQLGTAAEKNFPYLERNARWTGVLRDSLPLTDAHEQEIFNFFYKDNEAGQKLTKDQFFKIINDKVNRIDFDAEAALNLKNRVSTSALTDPITEQIREKDREIDKLSREITAKRTSIARARNEGIAEVIPKLQERISDLNKIILRLVEEKERLKQDSGRLERQAVDLFSSPAPIQEPVKTEPVKAEPAPVEKIRGGKKAIQIAKNASITKMLSNKAESGESWTIDEIKILQQYAGDGGLKAETRGVLYEYYTPYDIVSRMWQMVKDAGFKGGAILEPSVGIGRFLHYVDPSTSTVDAFEFSKDTTTGYEIAKITYPFANITNDYFESIFYDENERVGTNKTYDLVIGNPPYGSFTGAYAGKKREARLFKGYTYDQYFIWAGINLLNKGGLLAFIIPSSFLDNKTNYEDFKDWLYSQADLLDAVRLPLNIFDFTQQQTDIILLQKR